MTGHFWVVSISNIRVNLWLKKTQNVSPLFAGNTALHDCAESGSLEIMRMLLQYGASMEQDGYGMTPLLSASVTGHTNIVDDLTMHEQVRISVTHKAAAYICV